MEETFLELLLDPAHWYFEVFLILLFDGIIGLIIWPWIKKGILHHDSDHERLELLEYKLSQLENERGIKSI